MQNAESRRSATSKNKNNVRFSFIGLFAHFIPSFNIRELSLFDMSAVCEGLGVEVVFYPMRLLHGCSLYVGGTPYIYINSLITQSDQVIAGYHEIFHILYSPTELTACLSMGSLFNLSKQEYQAQAVGCIAYMPSNKIIGCSVEDLMAIYNVRREVAQFRLSLPI